MNLCNLLQYSSVKNNNNRTLDLVFSNVKIDVFYCNSPLINVDSHHPALTMDFDLERDYNLIKTSNPTLYRDFKRADYTAIRDELTSYDWSMLFDSNNVNYCVDIFYAILNDLIDKFVPLIRKHNRNFPTWYTASTVAIYKEKKLYHSRWKKFHNPRDYDSFSLLRSRLKKNILLDYKRHVSQSENIISSHINRFWNFVKTKKRDAINSIPDTMKWGTLNATTLPDKVNMFGQYFGSMYTSFVEPVNTDSKDYYNISISEIHFLITDIENKLRILSTDKAPGPDGIHPFFVKSCSSELATPLLLIYNKSLSEAEFPSQWKITNVTPIHKKGPKTDVTNYRPISKLSVFGKLFESLITDCLYLKFASVIIPQQHGFIKNRSSASNLTTFSEFLHNNLDMKRQIDVIYTDISKAFDQVDHSTLIRKLRNSGIHGNLLGWISSYLDGRIQRIVIDGCVSDPINVTSGVPQGSHLGPLLFILYINDIGNTIQYTNFLLYADDLKIYSTISTLQDQLRLQSDLNSISEYFCRNRLKLNISKCCLVRFTRNTVNVIEGTYTINGNPLSIATEISDLGVTFDSSLSFSSHINNIVNRAYKMLGFVLRVCKDFRHISTYVLLYKSLVRCHVEYCVPVWNPHYVTLVNNLERIQKKFVIHLFYKFRSIMPCEFYSYTMVRNFLGLELLSKRRRNIDLTFLFKIVRNIVNAPDLLSLITFSVPRLHNRTTRTFAIGRSRTNLGYFSPLNNMMRSFETYCSSQDIFHISLYAFRRSLATG